MPDHLNACMGLCRSLVTALNALDNHLNLCIGLSRSLTTAPDTTDNYLRLHSAQVGHLPGGRTGIR